MAGAGSGAGAGAKIISIINIFCSQFGGCSITVVWYFYHRTVLSGNIWLERELETEPKLWTKVEPEEKINNFGSATLNLEKYKSCGTEPFLLLIFVTNIKH